MKRCPKCGSINIGPWKSDVVYYNSSKKQNKFRYQYVRYCNNCSAEVDMCLRDTKDYKDPDSVLLAIIADKVLSQQSNNLYK